MSEILDIKSLIEDQGKAQVQWQAKQSERLDELESGFQELAAKTGSPFYGTSNSGGDQQETKSFLNFLRSGRESELQQKAMSAGSDPDGGYLVPTQLDRELTKYLRHRSPMRQLARVVKVESAEFKQPHSTLGTGYNWVGETSSRAATAAPGLTMLLIPTHEVYSMPSLTQQLLDDNTFDLENWLLTELSDAFGDAEASAFIVGNGVAKPRGLFTYDVVADADAARDHAKFQYVPTGAAGAFSGTNQADCLLTMIYTLKPQYRQNASWLMSPEVIEEVRKFRAGTSLEYLWQPSNIAGQPATLFGYPVFEDENVPAMAANSLSCAFGDFARAYTITDRNTSMLRDPYTAKPYVNFYSVKRVGGGGGRDTRAVKFLKFAAS